MKSIISDWVEGGYEVRVMRPPGGHQNAAVRRCAAEADLAIILWSVDTMDWKVADSGKIMKTCQSKIRNGSIVLMHDKLKATRSALSKLIPYLQEKGFQLVTVSELLESSGSPLESSSKAPASMRKQTRFVLPASFSCRSMFSFPANRRI